MAGFIENLDDIAFSQASRFPRPRAIMVDWIGTTVDMRGSMIVELQRFSETTGIHADWPLVLEAWLAADRVLGHRIVQGQLPWLPLEERIKSCFWTVMQDCGITDERIPAEAVEELGRSLQRMQPWSDSADGIAAMRELLPVAVYSINSEATLREATQVADIDFDHYVSAEKFRSYPPAVDGYVGAVEALGLKPKEVVFFSAYSVVLASVADAGMQAVQVARDYEFRVLDQPGKRPLAGRVRDLLDGAQFVHRLLHPGRPITS